jgi:acyl-CoA dehydrogenase
VARRRMPLSILRRRRDRRCETAVMTHGGYGYSADYHVERYLREVMIPRIAPIGPLLILCYIAERALGLPKSY